MSIPKINVGKMHSRCSKCVKYGLRDSNVINPHSSKSDSDDEPVLLYLIKFQVDVDFRLGFFHFVVVNNFSL